MSRVTFSDLYNDYLDINTSVKDCGKVQNVAIVPRKIVEMIIEKCLKDYECACEYQEIDQYANGICIESKDIKRYAESLLKRFEEE